MKKIILIVLVLLLTFSVTVYAENIYDLQQDKSWVDSKLDQVKDKLNKQKELVGYYEKVIKGSINNQKEQEEQLESYEQWLAITKKDIESTGEMIVHNEQMYAQKMEVLKSRIVDAYINSGINLLDVISHANNVNEVFEKIEVRKCLNDYDKQLLEDLSRLKLELDDKREVAKNLSFQYEVAINDTKTALANMNKIQVIAQDTVETSKATIEVQKARLNELEAESAALMNEIMEIQSKTSYTGGKMIWPLPADRSLPTGGSKFGMRLHPIFKVWKMHTGVDLGAPWDANILAANEGVVIKAGWSSGYGNRIVIDHGGGIATLYAHANTLFVKEGDKVKQGQIIALTGSTGFSTGPHLHFEVRVNGKPVDPLLYIDPSR